MQLPHRWDSGSNNRVWLNKQIELYQSKDAPVPQAHQMYIPRPVTTVPLNPCYPRTSDGRFHVLDNSSQVYNGLYPKEYKFGGYVKRTPAELKESWYLQVAMD